MDVHRSDVDGWIGGTAFREVLITSSVDSTFANYISTCAKLSTKFPWKAASMSNSGIFPPTINDIGKRMTCMSGQPCPTMPGLNFGDTNGFVGSTTSRCRPSPSVSSQMP